MDWFHPTGATGSPSPPPRRPEGGCIKKKGKERKVAWLQTTTTTTTSVPTLFLARKLLRRLPTSTTLQDGLSVASDSNSRAAPTQPPTHVQRGREKLKKENADDDQIKRNGTNTHTQTDRQKRDWRSSFWLPSRIASAPSPARKKDGVEIREGAHHQEGKEKKRKSFPSLVPSSAAAPPSLSPLSTHTDINKYIQARNVRACGWLRPSIDQLMDIVSSLSCNEEEEED